MNEKKIKKYTGMAKKLKIVGIILVVLGAYVIAGDIYKAINSRFNKGQLIVGIIMIMSGVLSLVLFNKYKQKISKKTIWELISLKLTSNLMKTLALISYIVFFVGVFILGKVGLVGDKFPLWGYFFVIITISSGLFFRIGSSNVAVIENNNKNRKDNTSPKSERRKLDLGTFLFTDEDRKRIKSRSLQYLPNDLTTPKAQSELRGGFLVDFFDSFELLGVVNSSTTYYFSQKKKQILRENIKGKFAIDEPTFFMELDNYVSYTSNGYIMNKEANEIAKKYLYLKNGTNMEYERALLAFECFFSKFKIVIHFGQLLLRWYGGYDESNRQKEAVVLKEMLPEGFTKWDLKEYEDVIRSQLKIKGVREDDFDIFLNLSSLPESIRSLSFTITLAEPGRRLDNGCILEKFELSKKVDDIIYICWSVGFGSAGSHNPGAGSWDPVPDTYFKDMNKEGLAEYIATEYESCGITKDDVTYNSDVELLFSLIHDCEK